MYALIFKATINSLDNEYGNTAKRMRELALNNYGCTGITSVTEKGEEVTISYWNSKEDIAKWKQNPEHLLAQKNGLERWYSSYSVEICKIEKFYSNF